jgi:sigma-B regulation protein RsbU (phosphoserine phosphatase)
MVTKDTEYRNSLRYIFNYHIQNEKKRFSFESLLINKKGDKLMINWLVEVSHKNSNIEDFILVGYEITKQVKIGEEFEKFAYSLMAQNRKLNEELQNSKASAELLEQDMKLAKKIQHGILPKHFPQTSGAKISAIYIPMDAVGGDFYDAFSFDKSFGIIISDVVGHGIPAALVTSMTKVLSYNYSRRIFSPKDFSEKINDDFQKLLIAGNFLTMFVAHYDYLNRLLKYSSCGHIPQIFCRKDTGDFILLNSTGPLMGIIPKSVYEERYIENVRPGDRLLMFTDGITEAKNRNRDMFGIKRLLQTIKKHYHKDLQAFKESIVSDIAEFSTGTKVEDDVSLVVIEFTD